MRRREFIALSAADPHHWRLYRPARNQEEPSTSAILVANGHPGTGMGKWKLWAGRMQRHVPNGARYCHCRHFARISQLVAQSKRVDAGSLAPNSSMGACSDASGAVAEQSPSSMSVRVEIRIVRTAFRSGVGTLPRRWPHSSPLLRTAFLQRS